MLDKIQFSEFATDRHTCAYLTCGPDEGMPVIFVHGWHDLAIGWEKQLLHIAGKGYRANAPDMRGYVKSSVHPSPNVYTIQEIETDLVDLANHLGIE